LFFIAPASAVVSVALLVVVFVLTGASTLTGELLPVVFASGWACVSGREVVVGFAVA